MVATMKYDPSKHRRHSIRLKGYDYAQVGACFVTIVTHNRECLFDDLVLRRAAETHWHALPNHFANILLDEWIVMPNHLHGIIVIIHNVGACCNTPLQNQFKSPSKTIGAIVRGFKSVATKEISKLNKTPGIPVRQRNYYEHIIRNEKELTKIRAYIQNNPLKWSLDRENPNRIGVDILEDEIFK